MQLTPLSQVPVTAGFMFRSARKLVSRVSPSATLSPSRRSGKGSSGAVRLGVSSRSRINRLWPVALPVPSDQLAASGTNRLERSTPSWLLAAARMSAPLAKASR
ncbi:hypothetical protein D3C77_474300 [compost metagenome]